MGPDDDSNPSLTGDMLELYFQSNRGLRGMDTSDIFVSRRASPTDPWGPATRVAQLSSSDIDETPEVAPDGLTLWLAIERSSSGRDVYVSTRPDRSSLWSTPVRVDELSSNLNDHAPTPSWSLLRMVMHTDRTPNVGRFDIFEAVRSSTTATWNAPAPVMGPVNTTVYEGAPHLSADDLTVYFDSNRPGGLAAGGWDIYFATRPDVSAPFGTPVLVREICSTSDDGAPWVSADGRTIVFSTNRDRNGEIYEATR
jgi:hypothetical protein